MNDDLINAQAIACDLKKLITDIADGTDADDIRADVLEARTGLLELLRIAEGLQD